MEEKKEKKPRICLSDSSVNSYGYRVLTSGLDIEAFKANPVMLYMHLRDTGSELFGSNRAIGHWEDIKIEGDVLSAVPVFDCVDELSKEIAAKFEAGTYNAASIGFKILETSEDKKYMQPGQTRATVTKAILMEASIVDVPANVNAVRLYNSSAMAMLAAGAKESELPALISNKNQDVMNLKDSWKTILAFLGIQKEDAGETQLSAEQVDKLEEEMTRLKADNTKHEETIATMSEQMKAKEAEIAQLKEQVEALKSQPAEAVVDPTPANEPVASASEDNLADFCKDATTASITKRLREEGLIK